MSAAQRAFDEGRALVKGGDYARACTQFEESQRLDPQLGTLLHLSNCYERQGKLASAWRGFSAATKLAAARNAAGENEPREAIARRRAENLEWRMSSIALEVEPAHAPALRIELDGQVLDASQWSQRHPVDPGEHQLSARAPGWQTWSHAYTIEREGTRLRILVPKLQTAAEPPAPPVEATVERLTLPERPSSASGDVQRIAGYVLTGVAIAGAAVAVAFLVAANDASSDQDPYWERCHSDSAACSAQDIAQNNRLNDRVHSNATVMYVVGGLSAGALIAGLTLLLTVPSDERPPDISLAVLPKQAYVSWRGSAF